MVILDGLSKQWRNTRNKQGNYEVRSTVKVSEIK